MNKRITSLLLCLVLIVSVLATVVPVLAASLHPAVTFTIKPDKASASPGDTITYTITLGPVTELQTAEFKLIIPDELEYKGGSNPDGLAAKLGAQAAQFTSSTKKFNMYGDGRYTSAEDTVLATFSCEVKAGTTGKTPVVKVEDGFFFTDADEEDYVCNYNADDAKVSIVAAPKPATDITLSRNTLSLVEGDDETLTANVTPADTTDTVVWSSDMTAVATVDSNGKVVAVAVGTATITATAGTKSAACTVTVTCKHEFTTIPEKASDCTNRGWDSYLLCNKCNELQTLTGTPLTEIPYRDLDPDAHDLDTTTWGYKGADGHAHTCNRNAEHHGTVESHNPDRVAPTETESQTCTQCGYVIAAATGHVHANHLTPVTAKAATCTEDGNKAYYRCSCGKLFADDSATVETTAADVLLPATGHSYTVKNSDEAHKRSTASDCREYDTYWYTCANDASHNAKDDLAATDKYYNGDRGAHVYGTDWTAYGDSGHAHKCLYHDNTDALQAHRPDRDAPTEALPKKCLDCGYIIENATGHVHAVTLKPYKAATCTDDGNKMYYECECGKYFEGPDATAEITNKRKVIIPHTGHSYTVKNSDEAHKRSTASDCREYDTYWYTCANDASHNAKDDPAATDKYYNGDRGAHVYGTDWTAYGDSGHAHKCLYHDNTDALQAHRPDRTAPTETEPVKCLDCGYVIANATGHVHAVTLKPYKAATCTDDGNKEYYECSCGKYFENSAATVEITNKSSVVIPRTGHSYTVKNSDEAHKRSTASDCREYDTYWYTCANDASHNAKDDPAAKDKYYKGARGAHVYSTDWTECGENGHAHKCLYDDSIADLTAHRPDRTAPTETEPVKCLDCGYVITPELGHTHSLVKVEGKDADCDDNGMKEHYKCEGCNKLFEDAAGTTEITDESTLVILATGHSFVWVTDKEPTEEETGLKHEECTVCHEKRNESTVIDKLAKPDIDDNSSKENSKETPETGDDNSMGAWVAVLFVSSGILLATDFYFRKRRSRAE